MERNFPAVRALDFLVRGAVGEPVVPANGVIPNQCFLSSLRATRPGYQKARTVGMPWQQLFHARAHEEIRAPCSRGS